MKKYIKEILILILQLFMFYIFPMFAGPTDAMGMVFLIWLSTIILAMIIAIISTKKIKYLYPLIIAIFFIPSIPIYYNESALIHSLWYLVSSSIGLLLGTVVYVIRKNKRYNLNSKKRVL